jgi:hypothetical protein
MDCAYYFDNSLERFLIMEPKTKKPRKSKCSDEIVKIGKIIKSAREKKKLTCAEVGMVAFKNPNWASQISLIERGQLESVQFMTLVKILKALDNPIL